MYYKTVKYMINKWNNRIEWNDYFMSIAYLTSSRSSCSRLHVGCCIVKNKRVIATGYNGFLSGLPHTSIVENNHEQATVHAEQNAISDAAKRGVNIDNSIAYITHYPCINCTKILIASGITHIYYSENYNNNEISSKLLKQANIKIEKL